MSQMFAYLSIRDLNLAKSQALETVALPLLLEYKYPVGTLSIQHDQTRPMGANE